MTGFYLNSPFRRLGDVFFGCQRDDMIGIRGTRKGKGRSIGLDLPFQIETRTTTEFKSDPPTSQSNVLTNMLDTVSPCRDWNVFKSQK